MESLCLSTDTDEGHLTIHHWFQGIVAICLQYHPYNAIKVRAGKGHALLYMSAFSSFEAVAVLVNRLEAANKSHMSWL